MIDKGLAWQKWWKSTQGQNLPMGGYHPLEGTLYEAFVAGWDAALRTTCPPCNGDCNQGRRCPAAD